MSDHVRTPEELYEDELYKAGWSDPAWATNPAQRDRAERAERRAIELAAQLEAAQKAIAQLEADVEHRDEIIQRLRSGAA